MELGYLKSSVLLFENVALLGNSEGTENFPLAINRERLLPKVKQWAQVCYLADRRRRAMSQINVMLLRAMAH